MPFSEQSMAWEMQNISPLRQEMHVGMTRELLAENVAGVGQANVTALMKNVHQRTLYIITALNLVDLYIYIYIYIYIYTKLIELLAVQEPYAWGVRI